MRETVGRLLAAFVWRVFGVNHDPRTYIAIRPPSTDACGKPATHVVEWKDGDRSPMCQPCALLAQELAESHGSRVSVKSR